MLTRRNCAGEFFFGDERAERKPGSDRLRDGDDIRRHAKGLKRKDRSRSPQPALNLIEDQRSTMPICQRATLPQEFFGAFEDSAFPKNRLQDNRTSIVVHRSSQALQIVPLHERHILEQRLKALAMLVLPRQRQRPKRPPMIRAIQRHEPALRLSSGAMSRQPRQLDRAFDGLGSTIREERTVYSRELAQLLRERTLVFVVVKI